MKKPFYININKVGIFICWTILGANISNIVSHIQTYAFTNVVTFTIMITLLAVVTTTFVFSAIYFFEA